MLLELTSNDMKKLNKKIVFLNENACNCFLSLTENLFGKRLRSIIFQFLKHTMYSAVATHCPINSIHSH